MTTSGSFSVRPAGRHLLTIGRDLIQDRFAAIVELVKNAYDADSPDVIIDFTADRDREKYTITVEDHGHGMSRDTVTGKWMVPSTTDKLDRRLSPSGRVMQGRKGIGRYAAAVLGRDLLLKTTTPAGETTTLFIQWDSFERAQYLDEVEILIETEATDKPQGTRLTITGSKEMLAEWDHGEIKKMTFELKKLIAPVDAAASAVTMSPDIGTGIATKDAPKADGPAPKDDFRIDLSFDRFLPGQEIATRETLQPYPIFQLFDYRISGQIRANGAGMLTYSTQKARNTVDEPLDVDLGAPTGCGDLFFDIRVYDRDRDAITSLIGRGLKDDGGEYLDNLQARKLLNEYNGIGVYRNGFRLRPLGDADFDWLKLNEQRIQNPTLRIGSNQVIGYVLIGSDEQSGLVEKSARDGLRENSAFARLKGITCRVIALLEDRRYVYRRNAGLAKPALKVERELERLFSFTEMKDGVRKKLTKGGVDAKTADDIIAIISSEEAERNRVADDIRQAVAVYQGQATLGKIINVVLHEGRRPLNYFKNQIPHLEEWVERLALHVREMMQPGVAIVEGVGQNAEMLVHLFGRLDPLAAGKRGKRSPLPLVTTIENTFDVFESELKSKGVTHEVTGAESFRFPFWQQDLYAIFTNLIDNSIYWMAEKRSPRRHIAIAVTVDAEQLLHIDYRDSGPGIEPALIASEVIFEPEFSTKPGGTGLGLAIAGEAAHRNGLILKAFESTDGAYFRLMPQ